MDLYHLYPVLQVRNVDLRAPSCDMSHERSHSEPVTGVPASNQIDAARLVTPISEQGFDWRTTCMLQESKRRYKL